MFKARSHWKAILLIGIFALSIGTSTPAVSQVAPILPKGIWWWGSTKHYSITLINLTDYTLKITSNNVTHNEGSCYPKPFQFLSTSVKSYGSAIWATDQTPVDKMTYTGTMTLLPNGMDPMWTFNLNFRNQAATGSNGTGTWVYLTASDTTNLAWFDSWSSGANFNFGAYQMPLGYPSPLDDGKPHNIMDLEGNGYGVTFAVSVFSPNNSYIVVVVQQMNQDDPYYRAWRLNWAENSNQHMP
jgi:hypothetical protein